MQETEKRARNYGREKIENIIRMLEERGLKERDLKNTAPTINLNNSYLVITLNLITERITKSKKADKAE